MKEVPEGFSRRQGAGIGLISKYAGLFLKSLFKDPKNPNRSNVYVVKGAITAEFRKLWGLQQADEAKSRENHTHHCIDAYTIACIGPCEYAALATYYRSDEEFKYGRRREKPQFEKPWPTFTEDLLKLQEELLIVHQTTDKLGKRDRRKVKTPRGKFLTGGDSARGRLHQETYYGAINYDGNIKYVVRKPLDSLTEKDLDKIVDETVKGIVKGAVEAKGSLKEALADGIYMNKEKGILIKRVRIFTRLTQPLALRSLRDQSQKEHKRQVYVTNESNYMMAIYEGVVKGKIKREFELVNNIEAAEFFRKGNNRAQGLPLMPEKSTSGFPLKQTLKIGTLVLLYETSPSEIDFSDPKDVAKRLYKVIGMSSLPRGNNSYGSITLRHHQEARPMGELKFKDGAFKNGDAMLSAIRMLHTQLNALVEGQDFDLDITGEIILKRP